jgi:hypothetical protein
MKAILVTCLFGGLLATLNSKGAELQPHVDAQQVSVTIRELGLPQSLRKDLLSGIQNKLLIRITARSGDAAVISTDVTIEVKYDLWDETFTMRTSRASQTLAEATLSTLDAVMAQLDPLVLENLFSTTSLPKNAVMTLQADVLMNPVEREKIERLRQWVAANSAPRSAAGGTTNAALTSKPNDLFNSIFEQYVRGAEIVAPWSVTVTSKPFSVGQPVGSRDQ